MMALTTSHIGPPILIEDLTPIHQRVSQLRSEGLSNTVITARLCEAFANGELQPRFTDANDAALSLFRVADLDELSLNHRDAFGDPVAAVQRFYHSIVEGTAENPETERSLTITGPPPVHVNMLSRFTETDCGSRATTTIVDITEHVQLQYQLDHIRNRQQIAIDATGLGIWEIVVEDGQMTLHLDDQFHDMLFYPRGELNNLPNVFEVLFTDSDRIETIQCVDDLCTGKTSHYERTHRMRCGNETYRWFTCRGEVTEYDDKGTPRRAIGTTRDIDTEVRAQQLLKLEREVLSNLASDPDLHESLNSLASGIESVWDQVKCAINLHDPQTATLYVGAAPTLHSTYHETVEGFKLGSLPTVCGLAVERRAFSYIPDFENAPGEFDVSLPFYETLGVKGCWSMPVPVGDEILATTCIFTLVPREPTESEVIHLERLAQTIGLLIQADRQKKQKVAFEAQVHTRDRLESLGKLAGGVAHDFNNLLTVVLANAEFISLDTNDEVRDAADQIRSASGVAADLCRKMLTYAGESPFELKPVNISDLAGEIVQFVQSGSPLRIQFDTQWANDLPATLGDAGMLSQLILNLVTNAAEAIDGSGTVSISTGTCQLDADDLTSLVFADQVEAGEHIFIRVDDDGIGLDVGTETKIFDPFFSTKPEGRGFGLATVFGVVRRHGGGIAVESQPGNGSTFTVYLPASTAEKDEQDGNVGTGDSELKRVAIIDDDESVRVSLARLLKFHRFSVALFPSGDAAMAEIARLAECDVILLDQQMPGMTGLETYREIRKQFELLPVCFMSGFATSGSISGIVHNDERCCSLDKPFTTHAMVSAVSKLLGERAVGPNLASNPN